MTERRVADEYPALKRLWAQMLEQKRDYSEPVSAYACDACQDTGIVDLPPDDAGYKRGRVCGSPVHARKPVATDAVKFQ